MSRCRTILRVSALLMAAPLVNGCGDAEDPAAPEPARPTTVTVSPATARLTALGATVQLSAQVLDQHGQAMAGASVSWASNDADVATVDSDGLVTAAANGTATITATAGGAAGTATVAVVQAAVGIAVTPTADTVVVGDTVRLVAEAFDENEHRVEGAEFTWSSSDSSVATVDGLGLVRGVTEGVASVTATSASAQGAARITVTRRPPKLGPGLDIFDFPMRAVAISGNWGTNRDVVQAWEDERSTGSLIPLEYVAWLRGLHVNWILISVALHYEDSMDSSVSRETGRNRNVPTWRDGSLRQVIREFRSHGFEVYMTLAFEAHEAEASSVHFARIAQQEGVALYSLGTETDRLFRSRPDPDDEARPESGYMYNDFGDQLRDLVSRVRAVYSGRLTYDMHANALIYADYHGSGSGAGHLWEDLALDIVGVSGWFPLTASAPTTVLGVPELQASYEAIFQDYLLPLASRNPGRAIVFTEYGSMDVVEAPADPSLGARHSEERVLVDANRNGMDDGEETDPLARRGCQRFARSPVLWRT